MLFNVTFCSFARPGASAAAAVRSVLRHPGLQHEQTPAVPGSGRFSRSTVAGAEHHGQTYDFPAKKM